MIDINSKVDEYIKIVIELGLFNKENINEIKARLSNISLIEDNSLTGDAEVVIEDGKKIIKINPRKFIEKKEYFLDEVFFHEFTHFANEIHNDLYNSPKSMIMTFKNKYSKFMYDNELAKYPEWGGILLDEAIAQKVAQTMVEKKYEKKIYTLTPHRSKIYDKSVWFYSTFADYPEYEKVAENFSKVVVGNEGLLGLARLSMSPTCLDTIFFNYSKQKGGARKLYQTLGYIGNIAIADYASKGHFVLKDSKNLRKKENVLKSYHLANEVISDVLGDNEPGLND